MRILIWGMMLFTSLHVYSATLPGFKGNLADKIHPSLKMALLKEEMISDTSYKSDRKTGIANRLSCLG